jgi:hypothetical protein
LNSPNKVVGCLDLLLDISYIGISEKYRNKCFPSLFRILKCSSERNSKGMVVGFGNAYAYFYLRDNIFVENDDFFFYVFEFDSYSVFFYFFFF